MKAKVLAKPFVFARIVLILDKLPPIHDGLVSFLYVFGFSSFGVPVRFGRYGLSSFAVVALMVIV
jgi:hypothetical protein